MDRVDQVVDLFLDDAEVVGVLEVERRYVARQATSEPRRDQPAAGLVEGYLLDLETHWFDVGVQDSEPLGPRVPRDEQPPPPRDPGRHPRGLANGRGPVIQGAVADLHA